MAIKQNLHRSQPSQLLFKAAKLIARVRNRFFSLLSSPFLFSSTSSSESENFKLLFAFSFIALQIRERAKIKRQILRLLRADANVSQSLCNNLKNVLCEIGVENYAETTTIITEVARV